MAEPIEITTGYIALKLARIVGFILVGVFGMSTAMADTVAWEVASFIIAGIFLLVSTTWSWKHDKKLIAADPPEKEAK